jgi:dCMP deaminase
VRPSIDEYFLKIAYDVATRATCDRKLVGAVVVKDKRILSTGYNGAPKGMPHCDDSGHQLKNINGRDSCVRSLHAESNALDFAGQQADGATIYCTALPCYECSKRIVNAGIKKVVYGEYYQSQNSEEVFGLLKQANVELCLLAPLPSNP